MAEPSVLPCPQLPANVSGEAGAGHFHGVFLPQFLPSDPREPGTPPEDPLSDRGEVSGFLVAQMAPVAVFPERPRLCNSSSWVSSVTSLQVTFSPAATLRGEEGISIPLYVPV